MVGQIHLGCFLPASLGSLVVFTTILLEIRIPSRHDPVSPEPHLKFSCQNKTISRPTHGPSWVFPVCLDYLP